MDDKQAPPSANKNSRPSRDTIIYSDDPVRMYLKEIGQVELLNKEMELWLSSQIAVINKIKALQSLSEPDIYFELYQEAAADWEKVQAVAAQVDIPAPDLACLLAEAHDLRQPLNPKEKSYTRHYLIQGNWGRDEVWSELAYGVLQVLELFYVTPPTLEQHFSQVLPQASNLPSPKQVKAWMAESRDHLHRLLPWGGCRRNPHPLQFAPGGQRRQTLYGPGH
jgi:hypothetical protein